MAIRRLLVLALGVVIVAGACEAFSPDELRYTITVENDSPDGVPGDLSVTLITADGQQTFAMGPGDTTERWNYLGGHFSVSIRPWIQQQISDLKYQRDQLEAQLLSADDSASVADLEAKVNALNAQIQAAYKSVSDSASCTAPFPESRQAFVQISRIVNLHINCGPRT